MLRRCIGKAVGALLISGGLLVGLVGCARLHELLIGPVETGPEVTLEAIPISVPAGEPVQFYISARAREDRKIESYHLVFGDNAVFKSGLVALAFVDRQKVTHVCAIPDGVDVMTFEATLLVFDNAGGRGRDDVLITVGRGQP
jgi:hypothetical protein